MYPCVTCGDQFHTQELLLSHATAGCRGQTTLDNWFQNVAKKRKLEEETQQDASKRPKPSTFTNKENIEPTVQEEKSLAKEDLIRMFPIFHVTNMKKFKCSACTRLFSRKNNVIQHMESSCKELSKLGLYDKLKRDTFTCSHCKTATFFHKRSMAHHERKCMETASTKQTHTTVSNNQPAEDLDLSQSKTTVDIPSNEAMLECNYCKKNIKASKMTQHIKSCIPQVNAELEKLVRLAEIDVPDVESYRDGFRNRLVEITLGNQDKAKTVHDYLENKKKDIKKIIEDERKKKQSVKVHCVLDTVLESPKEEQLEFAARTKNKTLFEEKNVDEFIEYLCGDVKRKVEEKMLKGSGWSIVSVDNITIKVAEYKPLQGSSFIPLPKKLRHNRFIINPRNRDNECFRHAIHAKQTGSRNIVDLMSHIDYFDWTDVNFPTTSEDVTRFERNNKHVSINLYGIDDEDGETIYPVKVTLNEKKEHFDLLWLTDGTKNHYCCITDLSGAVGSQVSKHAHKLFFCKRCLSHHSSEKDLKIHKEFCETYEAARIVLPDDTNGTPFIEFKSPEKSIKVPYVVYADTEALLKPIEDVQNNPMYSSTTRRQLHVPVSISYLGVSDFPVEKLEEYNIPTSRVNIREENPIHKFVANLIADSKNLAQMYSTVEPMTLTPEQEVEHETATHCHLCNLPVLETGKTDNVNQHRVRDHCHITGEYRGPAHGLCNLNARNPKFIPVFLHNLSNYDAHFIVKTFGSFPDCKIKVVPQSTEKYISFALEVKDGLEIRFLDSFRFLSSSLDNLCKSLPVEAFIRVVKEFGAEHLDLLRKKATMCYDYMDSEDRLNDTELPPIEKFYSKLTEEGVTLEQYEHAILLFKIFNCKTLGGYFDKYLGLDVCLLADIYEFFRNSAMETYKLDPAWYYTLPGLSFDAALKHTKVKLELITDAEMLFMIERGIRGGITVCNRKHVEVNNKELGGQSNDHIAYIDANNLYGWAMSRKLPTHDFKWEDVDNFPDIMTIDVDGDRGYIFDVDVEYPHHLHDAHSDLPFLPETAIPPGGKWPKLLTTLYDKKNYVCHISTLKQALQHGLVLKKINRVISFQQSAWLKSYIDMNTFLRTLATNDFDKDFYKLMNNAVYGKTMENVRKRIILKIINCARQLKRIIAKPTYKTSKILDENLCIVTERKKKVMMNKAIYVGFCILELSKTLMYEHHYDKMKKWCGDKVELAYMDTDSFVYYLKDTNMYQLIQEHKGDFDTSDYPRDHPCFESTNKKVLGKFKDEANGVPVSSFVGLAPKMYFMQYGNKTIKKAKGVNKRALKNRIQPIDYLKCLKYGIIPRTEFQMFRSKNHEINTVTLNKKALTNYDDKRVILPFKVTSIPHGHYRTREICNVAELNRNCPNDINNIVIQDQ